MKLRRVGPLLLAGVLSLILLPGGSSASAAVGDSSVRSSVTITTSTGRACTFSVYGSSLHRISTSRDITYGSSFSCTGPANISGYLYAGMRTKSTPTVPGVTTGCRDYGVDAGCRYYDTYPDDTCSLPSGAGTSCRSDGAALVTRPVFSYSPRLKLSSGSTQGGGENWIALPSGETWNRSAFPAAGGSNGTWSCHISAVNAQFASCGGQVEGVAP